MAVPLKDKTSSGAKDRTGTIAFMAISILGDGAHLHQPAHDCESIFWLCALERLARVDTGTIARNVQSIFFAGSDIDNVRVRKEAILLDLNFLGDEDEEEEEEEKQKDSPLLSCLIELARELVQNRTKTGFKKAFAEKCFGRCIEIVQRALDQQATDGAHELLGGMTTLLKRAYLS